MYSNKKITNKQTKPRPGPRPVPRPIGLASLKIKRMTVAGVVQAPGSAATTAPYFFQMSQLPDVSELTDLFFFLRLDRVVMTWEPTMTVSTAAAPLLNNRLFVGFNPRNSGVTPTATSIESLNGVQIHPLTERFSFSCEPVVLRRLGDQVSVYYEEAPCTEIRIDGGSTGLHFYGVDWYISDTGLASGAPLGSWVITYHVTCVGPR